MTADEQPFVLVVDDLDMFRYMATMLLSSAGYVVRSVANGAEAIDYLGVHPKASVIVLDLNMPVMGGLEFLQLQRLNGRLSEIPVVICSGEIPSNQNRFQDTSVVAYLPKENSLEELVVTVRSAIASRQVVAV